MTDFYTRMQATSKRLLTKYKQGTVVYNAPTTEPDPFNPEPLSKIKVRLAATVSGVAAEYVQPGYIEATDLQVTVPGDALRNVTVVYQDGTEMDFTGLADGVTNWYEWYFLPYNLANQVQPGFDLAGTVEIDGKTCQIIRVDRVPAAGAPVVFRLFVRA